MYFKFFSFCFSLVLASAAFSHNFEDAQFLRYEKLVNIQAGPNEIEVRCYDLGQKWKCPNPFDKELTAVIEQEYCSMKFLDMRTFKISKKAFENHENWEN